MAAPRMFLRSLRAAPRVGRPLSTSRPCLNLKNRKNDTQEEYERIQKEKPLNPHMTNTTSTIANEMPSIGKDSVPPEMITQVDPDFVPKDSNPSNTARMTGDTQKAPSSGTNAELDVGEIEGGSFRVEPLRRTGEDINTMRARLTYQSRKRGTLESDLLLSTFADANLDTMTIEQLQAYDVFLDENDWDIYYWVTQEPPPTSQEYAEGGGSDMATPTAQGKDISSMLSGTSKPAEGDRRAREPAQGEWAQTVGTFKAAYRPVPKRWRNSEILAMLRRHVIDRSAGGIHLDNAPGVQGKGLNQGVNGVGGGGIGRMPELRELKR